MRWQLSRDRRLRCRSRLEKRGAARWSVPKDSWTEPPRGSTAANPAHRPGGDAHGRRARECATRAPRSAKDCHGPLRPPALKSPRKAPSDGTHDRGKQKDPKGHAIMAEELPKDKDVHISHDGPHDVQLQAA